MRRRPCPQSASGRVHLRCDRALAPSPRPAGAGTRGPTCSSPGELVEIERRASVLSHGVLLPYPFQANLYGLPLEIVQECLVGFVEAREAAARGNGPEPRTFEEYAIARFGRGIARHFFIPYNTKLWGMHPNCLTPAWVSRYIPVPEVDQLIGGAIGLQQQGLGYNPRFLYPKAGGIDALPKALSARDPRPRNR